MPRSLSDRFSAAMRRPISVVLLLSLGCWRFSLVRPQRVRRGVCQPFRYTRRGSATREAPTASRRERRSAPASTRWVNSVTRCNLSPPAFATHGTKSICPFSYLLGSTAAENYYRCLRHRTRTRLTDRDVSASPLPRPGVQLINDETGPRRPAHGSLGRHLGLQKFPVPCLFDQMGRVPRGARRPSQERHSDPRAPGEGTTVEPRDAVLRSRTDGPR